jgi:hypothetical protein
MNPPEVSPPFDLAPWSELPVLPPPYIYGLTRSFERGLHVLILVYAKATGYEIISSVDHGTLRLSYNVEGEGRDLDVTTDRVIQITKDWDERLKVDAPAAHAAVREYFYKADLGAITGPISRESLFGLVKQGAITWDAQVWVQPFGVSELGKWNLLSEALGFPNQRGV